MSDRRAGRRPVVVVVLDGWGLAPPGPGNAIDLASTPVFDGLWSSRPRTTLGASGLDVGLPAGQMGNSEVGHLNLGAGRVVPQDLVRLADAVSSGSFYGNEALVAACRRIGVEPGATLHLMGLVSDGGVHSHVDHLRALVRLAQAEGVPRVVVHAITDGRDVSPHQAATLLRLLEREWEGTPVRFGTVSGRLWAMDRDGRWERTERFYRAVVQGLGAVADDAAAAVEAGYAAGVTDEFLEPTVIGDPTEGRIRTGDELVFFNFRPDRARQVCAALADPEFDGFDRVDAPLPFLTAMTTYWTGQPGAVAFGPERPTDVLADVLEAAGVPQLHAAETEKYPHVTYFFNGGVEDEHEGEERILVPSPREVRTYDEKPEMSARELTAQAVAALGTGRYGFAILNFANPDMVGHTGVIPAVIDAVQVVDACLGEVLGTVGELGGVALVTADHGNAERMIDDDGSPHTAHTTNPVPLVLVGDDRPLRDGGRLGDLAPTVLDLLGLTAPAVMTGRSLLGSPATL